MRVFKCAILAFIAVMALTPALIASAKHPHKESWYQQQWCSGHSGITEVVLPDNTRVDCVTDTHAIEFDFGNKWTEAVGQSLYYSMQTGKRAGIVLIVETEGDRRYWQRLNSTIQRHNLPIDTWVIN